MPGTSSKRYPVELRERAVRMVVEVRVEQESEWAVITKVAGLLGLGTPETLCKWVRQAEIDDGARRGVTIKDSAEVKRLKRENAELKRANAMAVSSGERNDLGEFLRWCHVAQGLAGAVVEASLDAA